MFSVDPAVKELRMFKYILNECIDGKFPDFKKDLDKIFFETKSLVTSKKNFFQIDRDYYNLIVYLSRREPTYFKKADKPTSRFYSKLSKWLEDSSAVSAFDSGFTKHFC